MNKSLFVIALIILLGVPSVVFAQTDPEDLSQEQVQALTEIRYNLSTVDDLEERGVIPAKEAKAQKTYYLAKTQAVVGEPLELDQLVVLLDRYNDRQPQEDQGVATRVKGFLTFTNIILVISSALLVAALAWILVLYIVPILALIPPIVYLVLIYVASLSAIIGGRSFSGDTGQFVALPGCLGFIVALAFTHRVYDQALERFYEQTRIDPGTLNTLLIFLLWALVAIVYQSTLIAFMAMIALQAFLGFSVLVTPLCYSIGFRDKEVIPRAMTASFFLLSFYVLLEILQVDLPYLNIFSTGALFMGAFVYYIGLLIVSSKWYKHTDFQHYLGLQLLTIVSGVSALFIGSVWEIFQLQGIGGTFFFLYLLEKYFEIPYLKKHWAWALLGLSVTLYLATLVIRQYPQYFILVG